MPSNPIRSDARYAPPPAIVLTLHGDEYNGALTLARRASCSATRTSAHLTVVPTTRWYAWPEFTRVATLFGPSGFDCVQRLRIPMVAAMLLASGCCQSSPEKSRPTEIRASTPLAVFQEYRSLCAKADVATLIHFYDASLGNEQNVRMSAKFDAAEGRYLAAVRDHWGDDAAEREAIAFQLEGQTDDRTPVEQLQGDTATIRFQRKDLPLRRFIKKDGEWKLAVDESIFENGAFALVYYLSSTGPFDDAAHGIRSGKIRSVQEAHGDIESEQKSVFDIYNGS